MTITTSTIIRFVAVILGIALVYVIRDILFALIFAVIIASAVEPSIEWFKKRGLGRIFAVVIIYSAFLMLLGFFLYLVLPLIADELSIATTTVNKLEHQILLGIEETGGLAISSFFTQNADLIFKLPLQYVQAFSSATLAGGGQVLSGLFSLLLVFIFSFYLATQEQGIKSFLRMVTPLKQEPYVLDLWERSQRKLGRWLRTQMLLGALVGVFIFIGLTMLGVQQALLFALIAAVFEIIPVAGPILAAIPAVITGFLTSPITGISIIVLYIIVQQTESHIIVPVVMKRAVGLSPLVVVVALLVGAELWGIFGLLLAVPLTTIGAELLGDWERRKRSFMPE